MKKTIPTPKFNLSKRLVMPLVINMHHLKEEYDNGKWHELIYAEVKYWAEQNQFQGKGTIWSHVMISAEFGGYDQVCCITAFGMTGFIKQLEYTLSSQLSYGNVRRMGDAQVSYGHWRPYLHLEHGKIWIASDAAEWEELP